MIDNNQENNQARRIMLAGGGTGGSVLPLLAVAEELLKTKQKRLELIFVGTTAGPEKVMVADFNSRIGSMKFIPLAGGKWRRYFSWQNFFDVFKIIIAFFKSFRILRRERPEIIISAGSFIAVPLVWAAALKKIPILVHQQDIRPGLANKLMAPFARVITVAFEKSLADYGPRAVLTGNPVASAVEQQGREQGGQIRDWYGLSPDQPLILVIGGSTGASALNKLVAAAAPELSRFCQIVHITGKGKTIENDAGGKGQVENVGTENNAYHVFEFLNYDNLLVLLASADLVVSRCGLGALTELSALEKPAILIPMPRTHQEDNAAVFAAADAAVVLDQDELTPEKLTANIKKILEDPGLRKELSRNIGKVIKRGAAASIAGIVWEIVGR